VDALSHDPRHVDVSGSVRAVRLRVRPERERHRQHVEQTSTGTILEIYAGHCREGRPVVDVVHQQHRQSAEDGPRRDPEIKRRY